jgi:hypothetical protein
MQTKPKPELPTKPPLTPKRAVYYGSLMVNLAVPCIFLIGILLGSLLGGRDGGLIGGVIGFPLAWLWWSFSVPRWREWAKQRGADEEQTQRLAESGRYPLVWPKGHFFEKTEFRRRKKN